MLADQDPTETADDEALEAVVPAEQAEAAPPDTDSEDDVEGFGSSWS